MKHLVNHSLRSLPRHVRLKFQICRSILRKIQEETVPKVRPFTYKLCNVSMTNSGVLFQVEEDTSVSLAGLLA